MQPYSYTIRKSRRAKNIIINVTKEKGVEIVIPTRVAKWQALAFLAANQSWIEKQFNKVSKQNATLPSLLDLRAINEQWQVFYFDSTINKIATQISTKTLNVYHAKNEPKKAKELLKSWLKIKAKSHFNSWLTNISQELCLPYNRLTIRAQNTLWGSCSRKANINLNSKLLFMEPDIVRMIMIHELLHTKHFNHSKQFWSQLNKHVPNYKELKTQLSMSNSPI